MLSREGEVFLMSKSKHHQGVHQWNPPPIPKGSHTVYDQPQSVASATECTGLTQQPVMNVLEAQDYSDLYAIHQLKPQGNVGKGNPNNDPSEVAFHRGPDDPPTHQRLPQERR